LEGAEKVEQYPNNVNKIPLVSICVQTYKHEKYIAECLDGILMQQTNFEFEILLGEDDSPDKTRNICIDYAKKYPEKIRLFLHDRSNVIYMNGNPTGRFNLLYNLTHSKGKYIAICPGDDYWTDPLKLQRQVDFLENNENHSLCCGAYRTLNGITKAENEIIFNRISDDETEKGFSFGLNNMKEKWITKTLNLVFRRDLLLSINFLEYNYFRDVNLIYRLLKKGRGYYFKKIFGVYRLHEGGIHSMRSTLNYLYIAYLIYKELYEKNKDDFTRYKYLKHLSMLFHYILYRRKTDKIIINKLNLLKEILELIKTKEEYFRLFKSLSPRGVILEKIKIKNS